MRAVLQHKKKKKAVCVHMAHKASNSSVSREVSDISKPRKSSNPEVMLKFKAIQTTIQERQFCHTLLLHIDSRRKYAVIL